jgi:hypothetical protein
MNLVSALSSSLLASEGISAPPAGTYGADGPYALFTRLLLPHSHGRGGVLEHITAALARRQARNELLITVCLVYSASPDSHGLVLEDAGVPGSRTTFVPDTPGWLHVMGPLPPQHVCSSNPHGRERSLFRSPPAPLLAR